MSKFPITPQGAEALKQELEKLKYETRPKLSAAIADARELGDLSENAEYKAAREAQGFCEGRIRELEHKLACAQIIDPRQLDPNGPIRFGSTVRLFREKSEEEVVYQIVGETEADLAKGKLSILAPLARALIGKEAGETVWVQAPSGAEPYEILSTEPIGPENSPH